MRLSDFFNVGCVKVEGDSLLGAALEKAAPQPALYAVQAVSTGTGAAMTSIQRLSPSPR